MPAAPERPPLNPFAAELRRAVAGAAAPDETLTVRELSRVSGVGRSAISDWLAGKNLPRSWDDGAVLVVDAIIKIADRYGKRFADEEVVRQRCKDAYGTARSAQQANGALSSDVPIPGIDATTSPAEAVSRRAADDGPEPGSETSSIRWWRPKYAVSAVAIFAVLIVAVALILLLYPPLWAGSARRDASGCIDKSSDTPWGAGDIRVCARDGEGSYYGHTMDKAVDGYCVRWRIVWDNKNDTYAPKDCDELKDDNKFDLKIPGVFGIQNAFLEKCPSKECYP